MYLSVAVKTDEEFDWSTVLGNEVLDGQRLGVRQGCGSAVVLVTSIARRVTLGVWKYFIYHYLNFWYLNSHWTLKRVSISDLKHNTNAYDQAFAQSDYFGLSIQSKSITNMWLIIQIQFSKWIDDLIQIQSQSNNFWKKMRDSKY